MQVSHNSLLIEDRSVVAENRVRRGAIFRRDFTIKNVGDAEEAAVNFWLETSEQKSEPLLSWYSFNPTPPLRIKQGEPYRIVLSFEVPQQTLPDIYNYVIVFEAAQYPGKSFRRPLQLQVIPAEQDIELDSDPSFALEPITTSAKPYQLAVGDSLKITVKVENRSKLVDRFYINCPELDKDWFTIEYPESAIEGVGIIQESDGLPLNPKSKGEITLLLHPPQYTPAGNYFPTIQLTSKNKEDVILLDIVYLQVLPDERLNAKLYPALRQVPEEPGEFELELTNLGNIKRRITIRASDPKKLFTYTPDPFIVGLDPGFTEPVRLKAEPNKWWRRPFRGKGLEIPFDVELTNTHDPLRPEPSYNPALLETLPQATIVWQARPWWVWLLPLLLLIGAIGIIALLLWANRPRPPVTPQVLELRATPKKDSTGKPLTEYQAGDGEQIRLDWKVSHFDQIGKITIVQLEKGVEIARKSHFFNIDKPEFIEGIPIHFRQDTSEGNSCKQTKETVTIRTNRSQNRFSSWWQFPFNQSNKETTKELAVLACQGVITTAKLAGDYTFQIQVFQKNQQGTSDSEEPIATRTTDTIAIKPALEPQVINFAATRSIYQEQPRSIPNRAPSPPSANNPGVIRLNWTIANASRIQALKLESLSPDGSVQGEATSYFIRNGILPTTLEDFCNFDEKSTLTCQNVPTNARKPGDYIFKLTVVVRQEQEIKEVTKNTEPVKIQARALRIASFKVNGQEARQKPKHVYVLSERGETVDIALSWTVQGGEDVVVELLPSPGLVPISGSMNYSISPPSSETITLKVSNQSGAQKNQSVVIQTMEAPQPSPQPIQPPSTTQNEQSSPSDSTQLSPIELPPQ